MEKNYRLISTSIFIFILTCLTMNLKSQSLPCNADNIGATYGTGGNIKFHKAIDIKGIADGFNNTKLKAVNDGKIIEVLVPYVNSGEIYIFLKKANSQEYYIYAHCDEISNGPDLYDEDINGNFIPNPIFEINGIDVALGQLIGQLADPNLFGNNFIYPHLHFAKAVGGDDFDNQVNPLLSAPFAGNIADNTPPSFGPLYIKKGKEFLHQTATGKPNGVYGSVQILKEITDDRGYVDEKYVPAPEAYLTGQQRFDGIIGSPYEVSYYVTRTGDPNNEIVFPNNGYESEAGYLGYKGYLEFGPAEEPFNHNVKLIYYTDIQAETANYSLTFNLTNLSAKSNGKMQAPGERTWETNREKGYGSLITACFNEEALYPDGSYTIRYKARDLHKMSNATDIVYINNFRPYVKHVEYYAIDFAPGIIGAEPFFDRRWDEKEIQNRKMKFSDTDLTNEIRNSKNLIFKACGKSDIKVRVTFSEPMSEADLKINVVGDDITVRGTWLNQDKTCEFIIQKELIEKYILKTTNLIITGKDKTGTPLYGFNTLNELSPATPELAYNLKSKNAFAGNDDEAEKKYIFNIGTEETEQATISYTHGKSETDNTWKFIAEARFDELLPPVFWEWQFSPKEGSGTIKKTGKSVNIPGGDIYNVGLKVYFYGGFTRQAGLKFVDCRN